MTNDDIAREILRARSYVVLATADADGVPWASPVWFAMESYQELYWVSYPDARHSQNIAARPQIAMVVFDSTVAPGSGQGVYMTATAAHADRPRRDRARDRRLLTRVRPRGSRRVRSG